MALSFSPISSAAISEAGEFVPRNLEINSEFGSFSFIGQSTAILHGRLVQAGIGSYSVSGVDAESFYGRSLNSEFASIAVNGANAFFGQKEIDANNGSYLITAPNIVLVYSGAGASSEWIIKARRRGRR